MLLQLAVSAQNNVASFEALVGPLADRLGRGCWQVCTVDVCTSSKAPYPTMRPCNLIQLRMPSCLILAGQVHSCPTQPPM